MTTTRKRAGFTYAAMNAAASLRRMTSGVDSALRSTAARCLASQIFIPHLHDSADALYIHTTNRYIGFSYRCQALLALNFHVDAAVTMSLIIAPDSIIIRPSILLLWSRVAGESQNLSSTWSAQCIIGRHSRAEIPACPRRHCRARRAYDFPARPGRQHHFYAIMPLPRRRR